MKATRQRITEFCENESPMLAKLKLIEAIWSLSRAWGQRSNTSFFVLIKRQRRVYTQVVTNGSASTLLAIIREKINENSAVYIDRLVDAGDKKHYQVKDSENKYSKGYNHINGIENFGCLVKTRLAKFRNINQNTFICT
ncbi:transposase [Lentisphaerota bacterium WC36G]|nr:transposase [Lentisphaerae bacterium WC36]